MTALIPEDSDERRMFDESAKTCGGPLRVMTATLTAWGRIAPQEGSFAKQCVIMANELIKMVRERMAQEHTLLRLGTVDDGPLNLHDIGAMKSYWSSHIPESDLVAPDGYELVVRKVGREVLVIRRRREQIK